jgi:DNA-binding transcriptional ArsR family regulator
MKQASNNFHLCFETLSNPLRISILKALEKGEKSVKQLSKELDVEQSTLSHSLAVLRECNFVSSKVKGKERLYSLSDSFVCELPKAKSIFSVLEAHYSKHCKKCVKEKQ